MTTDAVEVRSRGDHAGLFALRPLEAGAPVAEVQGILRTWPGRYSLQVGETAHVHPVLRGGRPAPDPRLRWAFANHGCMPNLHADVGRRLLIALRPVKAGEELVFDYTTTEWELAEPFACQCGGDACYGSVRGFRHLPPVRQREVLDRAASHIRHLHVSV